MGKVTPDPMAIKDWRVAACVRLAREKLKDHRLGLGTVIREEHIHSSTRYLGTLFKRHLGVSFHRYLLKLRMEAAAEMLARANTPVKRVAIDLGYDGRAGNFVNDFRRYHGTTPGKWRATLPPSWRILENSSSGRAEC
jgi:AraC-like DNA-binding protein